MGLHQVEDEGGQRLSIVFPLLFTGESGRPDTGFIASVRELVVEGLFGLRSTEIGDDPIRFQDGIELFSKMFKEGRYSLPRGLTTACSRLQGQTISISSIQGHLPFRTAKASALLPYGIVVAHLHR